MLTLTDYASIITAAGSIILAVFVFFELRHMDKHRDLEISMKLFEWAETDRLQKAFRWVEKEFQFGNLEKYTSELNKNLGVSDYPYQVEAFFEEVGFLVNKKLVDIDVIVDRLGAYIVSNWKNLEPWIFAMRKERSDSTFGEHFQILYEKTVKYMKKSSTV
jgi:hypothetical protein